MATFNISDIKGEQERIIQEGTAGSDTFIVGTNNGTYDPVINGSHSDDWGTDPATIGGEDKFILDNLTSKTVFIPNLKKNHWVISFRLLTGNLCKKF